MEVNADTTLNSRVCMQNKVQSRGVGKQQIFGAARVAAWVIAVYVVHVRVCE